ncbi:DUF397 domain-containing protein [Actinomadura algeriensis]|uniref:DUF397 domain-containing protein n=1 Tax=Actinomadura algeriensis TaxID=1679523 RepID=A0ABR9JLP8_9ACTN|nr:DUF397 domain-containing protein [Actinomadura algeriensis]MBE1531488.1 hypothetical protein [Actinomadura algeriensis]
MSDFDVIGHGWRRSTHCNANGTCVEVAVLSPSGLVGARDATYGDRSPVLTFGRAEWSGFIDRLKEGAFDLPQ